MTKNNMESLRNKAQEKQEEIAKTGNLWLPMKSDLLKTITDSGKGLKYKNGLTSEEVQDEFVKSIIPQGLVEHDSDYGIQYHLEFVNVMTGEVEKVPFTAQLKSKLEDLLELDEIELKEGEFEFDNPMEKAVTIKYCGKLKSMQDGDPRYYHTWTGERL